jgi:hypothetical protein
MIIKTTALSSHNSEQTPDSRMCGRAAFIDLDCRSLYQGHPGIQCGEAAWLQAQKYQGT